MKGISIISDGTADGTRVMLNGEALNGVTAVTIGPIYPGGVVTADITFNTTVFQALIEDADIHCEDPEIEQAVRQAIRSAFPPKSEG